MSIDPIHDVSPPFNAKYGGRCDLPTCEKNHGRVEPGDVIQCVGKGNGIMHMVCARRVVRNQAAPLCQTCWNYHEGTC